MAFIPHIVGEAPFQNFKYVHTGPSFITDNKENDSKTVKKAIFLHFRISSIYTNSLSLFFYLRGLLLCFTCRGVGWGGGLLIPGVQGS